MPYATTLADVRAAAERIAPFAHRTPVHTSATLDAMSGRRLFFKCEIFQRVGAFKFRGACNAVMKLPADVASRGVVTHSSGNHAQALALAARLRSIPAHIVMPKNSSAVKIRAVEGYGARVVLCEPDQASREGTAERIASETGATLIPPYNHPDIIAGQGTAALELLEQCADMNITLDAVIAPVGGGGLLSGICITVKGMQPSIRIFAGEPQGADDAARSFATNTLQPQDNPKTIADGLLTAMGTLTWPIIHDHVERVITVTDEQIIAAMRLVWERMKLVVEPSGCVCVAAAMSDAFKAIPDIHNVGIILSGGNIDLDKLPWSTLEKTT